ncbi:MAG: NERD domain-containing protein [Lachnospiraceae bacterium]|nr:NERD domain-containing protein [Lachnospiraceae bacterium]
MRLSFFGSDFELWKLHTVQDYLYFFAYLVVGITIFVAATHYLNHQRNHEKAVIKVNRKLKRLAKKPQLLFQNVTLRLPEGEQKFDGVLADKSGIFLIRTYGWGLKIYGTPDGETWRREDRDRKEEIPNPLIELKKGASGLQTVLAEQGVGRIRIMPMVVFADNYQTPELYLGYGSFSTTYQELKGWYRKQAGVKEVQYDFEKVSSILKELVI